MNVEKQNFNKKKNKMKKQVKTIEEFLNENSKKVINESQTAISFPNDSTGDIALRTNSALTSWSFVPRIKVYVTDYVGRFENLQNFDIYLTMSNDQKLCVKAERSVYTITITNTSDMIDLIKNNKIAKYFTTIRQEEDFMDTILTIYELWLEGRLK